MNAEQQAKLDAIKRRLSAGKLAAAQEDDPVDLVTSDLPCAAVALVEDVPVVVDTRSSLQRFADAPAGGAFPPTDTPMLCHTCSWRGPVSAADPDTSVTPFVNRCPVCHTLVSPAVGDDGGEVIPQCVSDQATLGGPDRAGKPAILGPGMKWVPSKFGMQVDEDALYESAYQTYHGNSSSAEWEYASELLMALGGIRKTGDEPPLVGHYTWNYRAIAQEHHRRAEEMKQLRRKFGLPLSGPAYLKACAVLADEVAPPRPTPIVPQTDTEAEHMAALQKEGIVDHDGRPVPAQPLHAPSPLKAAMATFDSYEAILAARGRQLGAGVLTPNLARSLRAASTGYQPLSPAKPSLGSGYERFSDRARKVMQLAYQEAHHWNHDVIAPEHLLLALLKEGSGVAATVLKKFRVQLGELRDAVENVAPPGHDRVTMGKLPQSPAMKLAVANAIDTARELDHNYIGTEHLLLGLLCEEQNAAENVLRSLGLTRDRVRQAVLDLIKIPQIDSPIEPGGFLTLKMNIEKRDHAGNLVVPDGVVFSPAMVRAYQEATTGPSRGQPRILTPDMEWTTAQSLNELRRQERERCAVYLEGIAHEPVSAAGVSAGALRKAATLLRQLADDRDEPAKESVDDTPPSPQ